MKLLKKLSILLIIIITFIAISIIMLKTLKYDIDNIIYYSKDYNESMNDTIDKYSCNMKLNTKFINAKTNIYLSENGYIKDSTIKIFEQNKHEKQKSIDYSNDYEIEKNIIISEKFKNNIAIIFAKNRQNENDFEKEIWISFSNDNGISYKKHFIGLENGNNYKFKSNSRINLFKNDSTLQIEADVTKLILDTSNIVIQYHQKIIDSNRIIQINIKKLIADSDNDGLSDIGE